MWEGDRKGEVLRREGGGIKSIRSNDESCGNGRNADEEFALHISLKKYVNIPIKCSHTLNFFFHLDLIKLSRLSKKNKNSTEFVFCLHELNGILIFFIILEITVILNKKEQSLKCKGGGHCIFEIVKN